MWNLFVSFQQEFVLLAVLHIASVYKNRHWGVVVGGGGLGLVKRKTEINFQQQLNCGLKSLEQKKYINQEKIKLTIKKKKSWVYKYKEETENQRMRDSFVIIYCAFLLLTISLADVSTWPADVVTRQVNRPESSS